MHSLVLSGVAATAALSGGAFLYQNVNTDITESDSAIFTELFQRFVTEFDKVYTSPLEREARFRIFVDNVKKIELENLDGDDIFMGINQFADMTTEEFQSTLTLVSDINAQDFDYDSPAKASIQGRGEELPTEYPATEDDKKCLFPVRDQGSCGSCWAFSTVASIETAHCKATGEKVDLSEQHLVDCDNNQGGCNGASTLTEPFEFVANEGGVCLASEYPYTARDERCRADSCATKVGNVTGFHDFTDAGATKLAEMINKYGAISVGIDGSAVQWYRNGVMTKDKCRARSLNHAVTAVGYGTDAATGKEYFLIKNSWGARWGEAGHIKMEYGACFLGSMLVAPAFEGLEQVSH